MRSSRAAGRLLLLRAALLALPLLAGTACGPGVTRNLVAAGEGSGGDGAALPDDDSNDDGGVSTPLCDPSRHFGLPALAPGLHIGTTSARLAPDERTAYLGQDRGGQVDILVATRASRGDPFDAPVPLTPLNGPYEDDDPSVTASGLTLFMDSPRSGDYQLYVSTRARTDAPFDAPRILSPLDAKGNGAPYLTPNGRAVYFHSWLLGDPDLFRAARNGGGFDAPERLEAISTMATEYAPVVSPDELTIYFLSLSNPLGEGIWSATRASVSESFGNLLYLPELSGDYKPPTPTWISPDGCRLYFRGSNDVTGTWIYVAERAP